MGSDYGSCPPLGQAGLGQAGLGQAGLGQAGACHCQWGGLSFEHMFEKEIRRVPPAVIAPEGEPMEFIYQGRRFHVHTIISRWRESGGWWNRIDDGRLRSREDELALDDGGKAIWRVEAAPIGAVATFEIELNEITGQWAIRPTSRASHSARTQDA